MAVPLRDLAAERQKLRARLEVCEFSSTSTEGFYGAMVECIILRFRHHALNSVYVKQYSCYITNSSRVFSS